MKTKNAYCLWVLWLLPAMAAYGQDAKTLAASIMKEYLSYRTPSSLLQQANGIDAGKMADAFTPYTRDSLANVRRIAFQMIHRQTTRYGDARLRKTVVKQFTGALDDRDASITSDLLNYLSQYAPENFDKETRYKLTQRAKEKNTGQDKVILLTGFLHIDELIYNYKHMSEEKKNYPKRTQLAMLLAMARMGDTTAIGDLLGKTRKLPVSSDAVYDFYPHLVYTCRKPFYDFLFSIILSDKKDCLSSNPDSEKPIICAFQVIELVAPYVKDFPVPLDNTGEAEIDNYPQTLAEVRNWIENHKDNYEIRTDKY